MKGIYIFLADGFEISEAMTPVDMLRRGGVNVKTVSIYDDRIVTSSNRIPVVADMAFGEFKASTTFGPCLPTDVLIFPGGMPGASNLAAFSKLMDIMVQHYTEGGGDSFASFLSHKTICKVVLCLSGTRVQQTFHHIQKRKSMTQYGRSHDEGKGKS